MGSSFCRSRLFFCGLPLLLVIIMSTVAGAQGFSPFAPVCNLIGQGACGQYMPGCSDPGDPGTGLSVLVGYASDCGKTRFSLDALNAGVGGVRSRLYDYRPISALYLGADLPVGLGRAGKAIVSGSAIIPATRSITETDYQLPNFVAPAGGSGWDTETFWGTLQGLYAYPASGACVLAGFRWDHWQTSQKGRFGISPGFIVASPNDTGALTVNGYIPLVGAVAGAGGFTLGAVGFPWVPGDLEFANTRNLVGPIYDSGSANFKKAWFAEIFADYRLPIPMGVMGSSADANLWLFGKINFLSASADLTIKRLTSNETDDFNFAFYRTMFVVGGKVSLGFNLPSL